VTTQPIDPQPVTLAGTHVRLEPPSLAHVDDLFAASQSPEIWEWWISPAPQTRDEMRAEIEKCIASTEKGERVWFVIIRREDNRAIGMTSFLNIQRHDRGLEIGGTWLTPSAWRTPINTECKYLLLRHAFEELGCARVQLKTDERNTRSRDAIERLGAQPEGVLRKYQMLDSGYLRNTAMYSIVDTEWFEVKKRLEGFLNRTADEGRRTEK
jgi:RimJ/RimL family protein N-acetyltransferase